MNSHDEQTKENSKKHNEKIEWNLNTQWIEIKLKASSTLNLNQHDNE
jgi:hypothetical protein